MKKYLFITFFILTSCALIEDNSIPINEKNIKSISIYHQQNKNNIIPLSKQEISDFVSEWNDKRPIGICKYLVSMWLAIEHKDGTKRKFRLNTQTIKENNDYCYKININFSNLL